MPRIRIEFAKGEQVRFLSHLDLMKTFERAIRRAQLPIAFSEGFNPHPKMNFASALAVGVTSDREYLDIVLKNGLELQDVAGRLGVAMPSGIDIKEGKLVPDETPALMASVNRAEYVVCATMDGIFETGELNEKLAGFMNENEIMVVKRTKKGPVLKNIRPVILNVTGKVEGENLQFDILTAISNEGSVRPEEVISGFKDYSGLPLDCDNLKVKRTALFIAKDGRMLSPMDV